ncbi:restriction endonuclease subunit S [Enterococcus cecorum]|uniref:restriction endonuclease subunit S n=2 Tax=Enterococcus cecorum TaxID=44008 RepID=UPI000B26495A|nr:restriction endonuclease subunit S [Enterococcus cecorum]CAI3261596.1 restriction endonuclease subunit S [Enterococcus cecorum]CAI3298567.1 restriction endonuclease subunit S [Enterococcus cecorum]CAI3328227.1 restriction endonuclease subunit S [Enterococcus cecorum]CAI3344678.1 restriction endonuclease subunit S [Enterococcus cecorum]CAI3360297.1 restriction endonuclease subunit S [Enterococcus cecorum]
MALTKYRLGELIEQCDEKNEDLKYTLENVRGISTQKFFIETKANMDGVSLKPYKVVNPDEFVYVADTSRRGDKIALAFNNSDGAYLVSSVYTVFKVKGRDILSSEYLFMYFNRPEFDRYSRFNSWGSARETFEWDDFCDIEIVLPPIEIQKKYVAIYEAMLENQKAYEQGLDDLKLVCDAYIEDLRRKNPSRKIGRYLEQKSDKNTDGKINFVMGLSTKKEFREAQARVNRKELSRYKIVKNKDLVFVPTTDTWKVLAFAINSFGRDLVVSPIYKVFSTDKENLLPEYLALWLSREEFDRYARFHSWGSARENFTFDDMKRVEIPIPELSIQKSIVDIYTVYKERKEINEKLKAQIKNICPILIKGSIEEARKKV